VTNNNVAKNSSKPTLKKVNIKITDVKKITKEYWKGSELNDGISITLKYLQVEAM